MKIKIKGADSTIKNLSGVFDKNKVEKALNLACITVENTAKENCPVGDTGDLRRSLTHEVEDNIGYIGTNLLYAPYVELGTGLFARDGDGRKDVPWSYQDAEGKWHSTVGQHPQPYLEPALNSNRQTILDIFKSALKESSKNA